MRIAINGSRRQSANLPKLRSLLAEVARVATDGIVIKRKFLHYLADVIPDAIPESAVGAGGSDPFHADVAISIGGDGTFLRTVQWVGTRRIPILGINTGHLGYLADLTLDEALARPAITDFKIEDRSLLAVSGSTLPADFWPFALNEAAILKQDTASMISISTRINGAPLASCLADGLIISTPTGSTGYNLSIGGPIVEPTSPVMIISPVAPHSLTLRPLVVGDNSLIEATVTSRSDSFLLSLDGRSVTLPGGSSLRFERAPFVAAVVQRARHHFAATLRQKLLWGEGGANR